MQIESFYLINFFLNQCLVLYLGDKMEAVELLLGAGSSPRSVTPRNGESQQYMDLLKACIISASHSQESFVQTVNRISISFLLTPA